MSDSTAGVRRFDSKSGGDLDDPAVQAADDAGSGAPPAATWSHSRQEAEVEDIVRALRGYRVLTRARLVEACGAAHWSDSGFGQALARAVSSGRVRQLGDDLYETTEPPIP